MSTSIEPVDVSTKKCEVCNEPINKDDYSHVQGHYFCGHTDCLTTWLFIQESGYVHRS